MHDKSEPTVLEATAALLKAAEALARNVTTSADHPDGVEWLYRAPYDNAQRVEALYRALAGFYTLDGVPRFPQLDTKPPAIAGDWWVSDGEGFGRSATLGGALAVYLTLFQPSVDLEDHLVITDPAGVTHPVTLPDDFDPDAPWGEADEGEEADDESAA